MSVIVTGGAGFIGSCIVKTLNNAGEDDIIIVDNIAQTEKWMNLRNKRYREYMHKSRFLNELPAISNGGGYRHLSTLGPVRLPRRGTLITSI